MPLRPGKSLASLHSTIRQEWLSDLAVFPLPRVVFFPGALLPLHLFEERYRSMIADCLEREHMAMAVSMLKPGYEENYGGNPEMHDICGLGHIEKHEKMDDGRYNILLRGISRVRVEAELDSDVPYRKAQVSVLPGNLDQDQVSTSALTTLLSTASLVATEVRRKHPEFELQLGNDMPSGMLTDIVADRLVASEAARQRLIETVHVPQRVEILTQTLAEILVRFEDKKGRTGPLH